jgi:DNA-binding protein HU-beta
MADSVNKKILADSLADEFHIKKKDALLYVSFLFESIEDALKSGDGVDISGFGKFSVNERAARQGINPNTKETIMIPSSKTIKFKPSKSLKESIK